MTKRTTFKVELEVSATHTSTFEDRDDAADAGRAAERSFMEGEPADEVGWPDIEIRRVTAVDSDGEEGLSLRVMRFYDIDTRGWRYVAIDDATNRDLAKGHDRDSVIRQGWFTLSELATEVSS